MTLKKASPRSTKKINDLKEIPLANQIVQILDDAKAQHIISIDLRGKTSLTDDLIIASGTSTRHVVSMADILAKKLKESGRKPKTEGKEGSGEWIVIDLGDAIVHLFCAETRAFYEIETLWGHKTPKE